MPEYTVDEGGQAVVVPEPKPRRGGHGMSDLFEVPKSTDNDMRIDHLFKLPEKDDLSDLVVVKQSDLTGYPEEASQEVETAQEEGDASAPHWSDADVARLIERDRAGRVQTNNRPLLKRTAKRYPPTPPQIGEMRL